MHDRPTRTPDAARKPTAWRCLAGAFLVAAAMPTAHVAAQNTQGPLEPDAVRALVQGVVQNNLPESRALSILRERCLAFEMTAFLVTDFTDAGASPTLIRALNAACVDRPDVASVSVEPTRAVMELGARLSLQLRVSDGQGAVLPDRSASWSTSDRGVADVDRAGTVVARSPGLAVISAEVEGADARTQVRVLPPTYSTGGIFATGLLLPGAAQFKVKRPLRGTLTLLATAGAVAWGYTTVETTQYCASPVGADGVCAPGDVLREEEGRPYLLPSIGVGVGLMLLSAIDAALHGKSLNEEADRIRANPFGTPGQAGLALGDDGAVTASWRIHVR